jgi:hypothetical protein
LIVLSVATPARQSPGAAPISKNSIGDAVIIETYADQVAAKR